MGPRNPGRITNPQERYDIFMNNYTEHTWILVTINAEIKELMQSYLKHPPRKLQSEGYAGPITITQFQRFEYLREQLAKEGFPNRAADWQLSGGSGWIRNIGNGASKPGRFEAPETDKPARSRPAQGDWRRHDSSRPAGQATLHGDENIQSPIGEIALVHNYFDDDASERLFDEMDY